jgi:hypothetical protein
VGFLARSAEGLEEGGFLPMAKYSIAVVVLFSTVTLCGAQYGSAENGYYPPNYTGETFTGAVTSTNNETREITLCYANPKDGKTQTFTGILEEGYSVKLKDGSLHELKPSEITIGAQFKVYYLSTRKKVDGKKTMVHTIFLIRGAPNARTH